MSKYPVKRGRRAIREAEMNDTIEVIRPANLSFAFRHSRTEISVAGGKAHVKARQTRLEDGKLTTETFEGDVDRVVFDRMARDAQRYFLNQTVFLTKALSWWFPSLRNSRSDRD